MSECSYFRFFLLLLWPAAFCVTGIHSKFICAAETCTCAGRVSVPASCDPTAISSNISHLQMGTDHYKSDPLSFGNFGERPNLSGFVDSLPGEMSVFGPTAPITTIPKTAKVFSVKLLEFDLDGEGAHRFNSWFRDVKHSVGFLTILNGRLTKLTSKLLAGFDKLEFLEIMSAGLKVIEPGAFRTLSTGAPPALIRLTIQFNKLFAFDWAVLLPIASSLERLDMFNSSLSVMSATVSVLLPKLDTIILQNNNLSRLQKSVVEIWQNAAGKRARVNLQRNPLCCKEDCSCCSLLPLKKLATFDQKRKETFLRVAFDCGDNFHYNDGYSERCTDHIHACSSGYDWNPLTSFTSSDICKEEENAKKVLNTTGKKP